MISNTVDSKADHVATRSETLESAGVTPTKKPRKPDRRRAFTRRAIVRAAARLFAEQGVDVTTVEEIAEAAQLSAGTLYFHFGSKEGVVLALVAEVLETADTYLAEARTSPSALGRVLQAGDVYFRFAIEQPVAFRFVSAGGPRATVDTTTDAAAVHRQIESRMEHFAATVAADLQQAIVEGEVPEVALNDALALIWGIWNGVAGLVLRADAFTITPDHARRALELSGTVLRQGLTATAG